jgi:hypothetical protein
MKEPKDESDFQGVFADPVQASLAVCGNDVLHGFFGDVEGHIPVSYARFAGKAYR